MQALKQKQSGLVGWGVTIRIKRFPVLTPLGARPDFGSELRYEVPDYFRV